MKHNYTIKGMSCTSCAQKIQAALSKIAGIQNIVIDVKKAEAEIEMTQHIALSQLQDALKDLPKYQIMEPQIMQQEPPKNRSFFATYKPILLIFGYVSFVSLIGADFFSPSSDFDFHVAAHLAMRIFMSGFFLVFSFFKLLNLRGFVEGYSTYDIIAKRFKIWGFFYVFIELALGIAYALDFYPTLVNGITFVVMSLSIIGVLQSVLNRKKIQCVCLGTVFELPMSTITLVEDALMIVMSGFMLLHTM